MAHIAALQQNDVESQACRKQEIVCGDSLIPSDRLGLELPNSALVGGDAVAPLR